MASVNCSRHDRRLDVYSERVREIAREENVPLVDGSARFEA
jgi:hypothetical protein